MKNIPAFITLTIITLVAAMLLATSDYATRDSISRAAEAVADAARFAVLPTAESFEKMEDTEKVDAIFEGSAGGQAVGRVATVTVQGFGGPIEITVGMDVQGKLTGIRIGGTAFAETAGLGSEVKEPAFTDQFVGKSVPIGLGETIDAISGATITSRAVVDGVNIAAAAMGSEMTREDGASQP